MPANMADIVRERSRSPRRAEDAPEHSETNKAKLAASAPKCVKCQAQMERPRDGEAYSCGECFGLGLTALGNPAGGDAGICRHCGRPEDYLSEDVYGCIDCMGKSDEEERPRREEEEGEGEEDAEESESDSASSKSSDPEPNSFGGYGYCNRCAKHHDWYLSGKEYMSCRPPPEVFKFGEDIKIDSRYRAELDRYCTLFSTEEIVGSYLGHNPHFPSQEDWLRRGMESDVDGSESGDE